ILGDGGDLHPTLTDRHCDWLTLLVPAAEAARTDELNERQDRKQGVLAPALAALDDARAVDELSMLIDGVPPKDDAQLFKGELPRLAAVLEVVSAPASDLPAERPLGDLESTEGVSLPRWPDVIGDHQSSGLPLREA